MSSGSPRIPSQAWALLAPASVFLALVVFGLLLWRRREWLEAYVLGTMTPRRYTSLQVKAKILFVMEQIAIGVPAQLPAVALPTGYLRYLDARASVSSYADEAPRRVSRKRSLFGRVPFSSSPRRPCSS